MMQIWVTYSVFAAADNQEKLGEWKVNLVILTVGLQSYRSTVENNWETVEVSLQQTDKKC